MLIKVAVDKERVKSIFGLTRNREELLATLDYNRFPTPAAEGYYEVIKELAIAFLLLNGLKAAGESAHKDLIDALGRYGFTDAEIRLLQDLRIKRNDSQYEGKPIERIYLENKKEAFALVIQKLKKLVQKKIS